MDHSYGIVPFYKVEGEWRILLVHHILGHWSFPKGHIDAGEDPHTCALREFQEETGLAPCRIVFPDETFVIQYPVEMDDQTVTKSVTHYMGVIQDDVPLTRVGIGDKRITEYEILPYAAAVKRATHDTTKDILRWAHSFVPRLD